MVPSYLSSKNHLIESCLNSSLHSLINSASNSTTYPKSPFLSFQANIFSLTILLAYSTNLYILEVLGLLFLILTLCNSKSNFKTLLNSFSLSAWIIVGIPNTSIYSNIFITIFFNTLLCKRYSWVNLLKWSLIYMIQ